MHRALAFSKSRRMVAGMTTTQKLLACAAVVLGLLAPLEAAESPLEMRLVVLPGTPGAIKKTWGETKGDAEDLYLAKEVLLDAGSVAEAAVVAITAQESKWQVEVRMTDTGKALLAEATTRHTGQRLAILAEGKVIVVAVVAAPITGGVLRISGNLTEEEARSLAGTLNKRGVSGRQ